MIVKFARVNILENPIFVNTQKEKKADPNLRIKKLPQNIKKYTYNNKVVITYFTN